MPQIAINPVKRIEGHATIRLFLDNAGKVENARFQVNQIRGFEQFVIGRPFYEMPDITARICGICPVSHALASAKACDQILALHIPQTAIVLRSLLNLAQLIQSHALSYFFLSAPDLLLGLDTPPEERNLISLAKVDHQFSRDGIRLRQFGQQIIERLAGRRIHPSWVVPGGVKSPLGSVHRDAILADIPEIKRLYCNHLDRLKSILEHHQEQIRFFAHFPSLFLGLVNTSGELDHYQGHIRIIDSEGSTLASGIALQEYPQLIGEAIEPWTYLKFPYYRPLGYPDGMYRVGPLARLNLISRCGTELADRELVIYRQLATRPILSNYYSHYARLLESLYAVEKIEQLLADPNLLHHRVRSTGGVNNLEGIGGIEAPRGTLIHHYRVNEDGLIESCNLIIATGHNNLAMQKGVLQVAQQYLSDTLFQEGALNRIEAVVRTFDPCLSCSTHTVDTKSHSFEWVGANGVIVAHVFR
ncbi:MAG: Ni/Fe hydrogenase subunit alpha [Desulfobulbus sp.]|nr:Ni/Fe hydrogenase subunit alpha [Desulfobulbus sp.]